MSGFDQDLADTAPADRWQIWMRRIEAVLFASATPVARAELARVVGQGVSLDLLIADLEADLADRPYELVRVGDGWLMRTRPAYAPVIRAAADIEVQEVGLNAYEAAVLGAIAYRQPITREGLRQVFGKEVSRDLIGRLNARGMITTGPRSPTRGAPYTFVTTQKFLLTFDMKSLRDLPDWEALQDAGVIESDP